MHSSDSQAGINLAEPGAGVPWGERKLIDLILRFFSALKNQDALADMFLEQSDRIILLADRLDDELLAEPVMIDRIRGMEDSSRNWSVMMVLEHLNMVNAVVLGVVKSLLDNTDEGAFLPEISVVDVKPSVGAGAGAEIIDDFAVKNQEVIAVMQQLGASKLRPSATHRHPWFGELNAKQWCCLLGLHMRVHRRQIEEIIKKMGVLPDCRDV